MYRKRNLLIVTFLAPVMLFFVINVIYPVIISFYYTLQSWDSINPMKFVGLKNYADLFKDPVFFIACRNTFYLVLGAGVLQVAAALVLAVMVSSVTRGYKLFRTVYFFPVTMSAVAIALMFSLIYGYDHGLLNDILSAFGLGGLRQQWIGDVKIVPFTAIFPQIWQYVGFVFIILLASIGQIPAEIYEYAKIDGAGGFRKVFNITIPLTWEAIQICIVLGVTGSLSSFNTVLVLTGGGPMQASELLGIYMYNSIFKAMQFGYGSAIAFIIFVLGALFTIIFKRYFSGETVQY